MVVEISNRLALALCKGNAINQEEIEVYAYGIQLIILGILDWSVTFIIMLLINEFLLSAVYLTVFIMLRHRCGGYHAKTHMRCMIISNVVYLSSIYIAKIISVDLIWLFMLGEFINFAILMVYAPTAHKNKPVSNEELKKHKKAGRILNIIISCTALVLLATQLYEYAWIILLGQLSVSLAIFFERMKQQKGVNI
ncbi:MAG: accessory gene regulator B family protein [Clostridia bacterium]|nr:accessory gene regulator B family protein [Clostridia bacterium]